MIISASFIFPFNTINQNKLINILSKYIKVHPNNISYILNFKSEFCDIPIFIWRCNSHFFFFQVDLTSLIYFLKDCKWEVDIRI